MNSKPARNDESWPGNRRRYGGDIPDSGDLDDIDDLDDMDDHGCCRHRSVCFR